MAHNSLLHHLAATSQHLAAEVMALLWLMIELALCMCLLCEQCDALWMLPDLVGVSGGIQHLNHEGIINLSKC